MLLSQLFVEDELLDDLVMRLCHLLQDVLELLVDECHCLLHNLFSELLDKVDTVLFNFAQVLGDVGLDLLLQQLGKVVAIEVAFIGHVLIVFG